MENVIFYSLGFLFITPLLPRTIANVVLGLFVLLCVINFIVAVSKSFGTGIFVISSLLFLVFTVSLTYTDNLDYGIKKVTTALPLLLLPLSLAMWTPALLAALKKHLNKLLYIYVGSIILVSLFTVFEFREEVLSPGKFHAAVLASGLSIGMDALYYSFHLAMALISTVYLFWSNRTFYKQLLLVVAMAGLSILLLMLSFKSTIIAFIIAFGLFALKINHYKVWTLFTSILILVIGLVTFSTGFNKQFADLIFVKNQSDMEYAEIKKTIQLCVVELAPEAGLFGFGIGDGKQELIACYNGKNQALKNSSYNSHNQYLGIYLKVGLVGLLALAVHLLTLLFLGLNRKNHLGTSVLILIGIFMLAENILEREQGVYYFAVFLGVLFLNDFKKSPKNDMVLSHEKVLDSLN